MADTRKFNSINEATNKVMLAEMRYNSKKMDTLQDISADMVNVERHIKILSQLDRMEDSSGMHDLHDQINVMYKAYKNLATVVDHALSVVPKNVYNMSSEDVDGGSNYDNAGEYNSVA